LEFRLLLSTKLCCGIQRSPFKEGEIQRERSFFQLGAVLVGKALVTTTVEAGITDCIDVRYQRSTGGDKWTLFSSWQKHGSPQSADDLKSRFSDQVKQEILSGKLKRLEQIDSHAMYRFKFEECGWQTKFDNERNQNGYTNGKCPCVVFNYPISLPEQEIFEISDGEGDFHFQEHTNIVQFCNMNTMEHVLQAGAHHFLQIGLEDEMRSATYRPPWQHIIFHQGQLRSRLGDN
jgi:hypothetical protein